MMRARVSLVVSLAALLAALPAVGAAQTTSAPRAGTATPATRTTRSVGGSRDLNGFWQALNTAHWDLEAHEAAPGPVPQLGAAYAVPPGLGVVVGGPIPYKPEALALKKTYAADALREDPEVKCYLPGVPRVMYMPYPVQIVQSDKFMLIMSEFASAQRTVYMNGSDPAPADTWMGWSNGRWEGDTLVIDSTGFMGNTVSALDPEGAIHARFLDRAGNFHTDGLHVVERIRKTDADHLMYEATIEDPNVYTRPWTIRMPLYRRVETNMQLGEFKCEEFVSDQIYGKYQKAPGRGR